MSRLEPHDQLRDPQQPGRTIDMLRARDVELPEFHAHQLSIANMLAILDLAVLTTRAANAALTARCGELERALEIEQIKTRQWKNPAFGAQSRPVVED